MAHEHGGLPASFHNLPPEQYAAAAGGMAPPMDGGLPPELAALLGGGAPMGAAPMGAPPQQGGMPATDDLSPEDNVRAAIAHAQKALEGDDDDLESADIVKALSALYKVMGGRQKEQEAAMGTSPAVKGLARAYG